MSTSPSESRPQARTVQITERELIIGLVDGRRLSVPLAWFPRLQNASTEARGDWRLIGDGEGISWPAIDEDLSVEGLLLGARTRGSE